MNHKFQYKFVRWSTKCDYCDSIIWGLTKKQQKAKTCQYCDADVHDQCVENFCQATQCARSPQRRKSFLRRSIRKSKFSPFKTCCVGSKKVKRSSSSSSSESSSTSDFEPKFKTICEKSTEKLVIHVGTFNAGSNPPDFDFSDWIEGHDETVPDIYIFGLQEISLTEGSNLMFRKDLIRTRNKSVSDDEIAWTDAMLKVLNKKGADYVRVDSLRLFSTVLMIFAKKNVNAMMSENLSTVVPTGDFKFRGIPIIMEKFPNKGGVVIRLKILETTLCIVTAHFAPHQELTDDRHEDYKQICKRGFKSVNKDLLRLMGIPKQKILAHDCVIWLGDLNYRIDLENEKIRSLANAKQAKGIEKLLSADQLISGMAEKKVFKHFREHPIAFGPTYKFDPGTDTFDTSPLNRRPAYCDRILVRGDQEQIKTISYTDHPTIKVSDHKPVSCRIELKVVKP